MEKKIWKKGQKKLTRKKLSTETTSTCASVETDEDSHILQESLFAALIDANNTKDRSASLAEVQVLLEKRACVDVSWRDPERKGILMQMPQLVTLSPIPLACMQRRLDLITLLIEYRGDLNDQVYSFKAGLLQKEWKGNSTHVVVARKELSFLQSLVELRARLDICSQLGDTNGANLVWQASYFGHVDMLKYLLDNGVPSDVDAPSQDDEAIAGLFPITIAARVGHAEVIRVLHRSGADINIINHDKVAPINCGIRNDEIEVVLLLVTLNANIVCDDTKRDSQGQVAAKKDTNMSHFLSFNNYSRPLDHLFARNNSVLIAAVAEGLTNSPKQVEHLTHDDILAFLGTPGEAPRKIMNALFQKFSRKKALQYCHETSKQRVAILTAYLQDFNWGILNTTVGPHPSVLETMLLEKRPPIGDIKIFFNELAPQEPQRDARNLRNVIIYRSLVPNMHLSARILGAISDVKDDTYFELPAVQAFAELHWQATKYVTYMRLLMRILDVLAFIAVAMAMNYDPSKCRVASCLISPLFLCSLMEEVILVFVFGRKRLKRVTCWIAWIQIICESYTLAYLIKENPSVAEQLSDLARAGAAFTVICHWARVLLKFAIFDAVGKEILPILGAVRHLVGISIVSLFYILAFTHAYWSFQRYDLWDSFLQIYALGALGEFELADLVNLPEDEDAESRRLVADPEMTEIGTYIRILFLCVSFWIFIVIVNIFIGVLSNGYNQAEKLAWPMYLQVRARATVEAETILDSFGLWKDSSIKPKMQSEDDEDFSFMYYCIEADSSSDSDDDQDVDAIRSVVRTQVATLLNGVQKSLGEECHEPSQVVETSTLQLLVGTQGNTKWNNSTLDGSGKSTSRKDDSPLAIKIPSNRSSLSSLASIPPKVIGKALPTIRSVTFLDSA